MTETIKFRKYFVSNGTTKARISYSLDNRVDGRKCVTLYAKDYNRSLGKIFIDYKNDTDTMTDYFDAGHVNIFEDNKHYKEARNIAESIYE